MSSESDKTESRYRTRPVPEFKSTIPPHVLAKLPESERYLVEMVSKVEQRDAWLTDSAVESRQTDIEIDVRVSKMEKLIERLTNKWSVVGYVALIVAPVIVKFWLERWLKP